MLGKRTKMSKIHDVIRLKFDAKLSNRDVAHCLKIGAATVSDLLGRFKLSGYTWPLPDELTEAELEKKLFPKSPCNKIKGKAKPDFSEIHQELKRKGMTKLLLWQEYLSVNPDNAYKYTQFCNLYSAWLKKQKRSMRQHHMAGEKLFIDYCGPTVPIVNPETGEIRLAQIFVATLGASNYTYVEASDSQNQENFLMAHVNAFEFFGGVPALLIPDNLKSAVIKANRYEPVLNENYLKLARHYNTAIMPARPYKPKDKAKVENAVLVVERWILMRLRKQIFHTMASLNLAIKELLIDLNQRAFKQLPGNRKSLFELLDKPALKPLPKHRYEYVDNHQAKVGIDYHILYKKHAYSVPNIYVGERINIEASKSIVRIYFKGKCISQHPRSLQLGGFSTKNEHMPISHQKQNWSPARLLNWGNSIGPKTEHIVKVLLDSKTHPEQAYRACLGLLNLCRTYGEQRLEQACLSAIALSRPNRQTVANLLKNNFESNTQQTLTDADAVVEHSNIRGENYYH